MTFYPKNIRHSPPIYAALNNYDKPNNGLS